MFKQALFTLLLLPALPTHALDTEQATPEQLLQLGNQLAASAGPSQWQQLWQRTRTAGYLQAQAQRPHFTLEQLRLPALAEQALAQADQVEALGNSVARYRRQFPGQVIGMLDQHTLDALCLEVDWRTLPQGMVDHPQAYLGSARLLSSYPCN